MTEKPQKVKPKKSASAAPDPGAISDRAVKLYMKKSVPQLIKIATKHFNEFIRLRDSNDGSWFVCISCERHRDIKQMNAGHFYPTTKSGTRFNELNVHGQCIQCNHYLSGNLVEYGKNLTKKIGADRMRSLAVQSQILHRWDKFELIGIIETYKARTKQFKKVL